MEVILLERVPNLGQLGQVVKVKPGYARNFLLPTKKALRATKENLAYFERQKSVIVQTNEERRKDATAQGGKVDGASVVIVRQAAESGQLYGSVSARDIADAVSALGHQVERSHVVLNQAIKTLGLFPITIALHPEVSVKVTVNIARSEEEAKTQAVRGEALIGRADDDDDDAEEAAVEAASDDETDAA
jgi:large subunit ribosomal protein L9